MTEIELIGCTSNMLHGLRRMTKPTSCWLHFDAGYTADVRSVALQLLSLNFGHFAVSGVGADAIHDEIDDAVFDQKKELILTTWHAGSLEDVAVEFLAVNCAGARKTARLVVAFGSSRDIELKLLSEMVDGLRKGAF
jgi:hypothetical protein